MKGITTYSVQLPTKAQDGSYNLLDFTKWCDSATARDLAMFCNDEAQPWCLRSYVEDLQKLDPKTRVGFFYDRIGLKTKAIELTNDDFEIQL